MIIDILFISSVSLILLSTKLIDYLKNFIKTYNIPYALEVVNCPFCFSFWVSLVLALILYADFGAIKIAFISSVISSLTYILVKERL